jgi:hypothetical protein
VSPVSSRRRRVRYSVIVGTLLVALSGVAPTVPVLMLESQLADAVEGFANSPEIMRLDDSSIRSRVQQLARSYGFHIEFDDVFVRYLSSSQEASSTGSFPPPTNLGYTLPMELPLFGLLRRSVVGLRYFPIRGD